jgi:MFS family permease
MRLFGQGALTLTATSLTIKQFTNYRGSALSITQLGYPLSEFIFPGVLLYLLNLLGWRASFLILAAMILVFYYPLSILGIQHTQPIKKNSKSLDSKSLADALKDVFFPFYVALSSIPPIMMTGALYFQVDIFIRNQWPLTTIAFALFFYALFKFINTILIGPIIDRFGVVFPLFFLTACMGLATLLISIKAPPILGIIYYSLYGLGLGASAATMSYLWGVLYGSDCIGEIKGTIAIIRNGATAIAPIGFSFIMNAMGVSLASIFYYCGILILIMSVLPFIFYRLDDRLRPPGLNQ